MSWAEALRKAFPAARLREPLSEHTTFHIGGPADAYLEVASVDELTRVYHFLKERPAPVFLLGWGSNLLVRDGGVRGLVLRLRGEFEAIEFLPPLGVRAGAGVRIPQLVLACAERGLAGSEPLVGVPGTVGGALVMNAGTRDGEIGGLVERVRVFDAATLSEAWLDRSKLVFGYRHSNLGGQVVLGVELRLNPGSKVDILDRVQRLQSRRLKTQPVHTFNVGSVFKNPPGHFVAKLIEDAGLKGLRQGGAKVSDLHANFIENDERATAADVLALVEKLRAAVRAGAGIELELEMKVIGEA